MLFPIRVHAADVHDRKVVFDVLERHPEDRHLVVHGHVRAIDHAQLELQIERPPVPIFAPSSGPCSRRILAPRVANLHQPVQLPARIRDLANVENAISVRRLQAFLQDLLLGFLATLLGATHAHEITGLPKREELRPEHVVSEVVVQHEILLVLFGRRLASKEHLGALGYLLVSELCPCSTLLRGYVEDQALGGEAGEHRQGLPERA
mmetsp:Transcript_46810/g.134863  ORF Transcript_46810/g.134863 Transcript_46810/m.134863 type:complete len:207 (-) Transcript_46810:1204-1824(-)